MIKVKVNNEVITLHQIGSVSDLTELLNINGSCSLIRINNKTIEQAAYTRTRLRSGDYVDISIDHRRCKTLRQV